MTLANAIPTTAPTTGPATGPALPVDVNRVREWIAPLWNDPFVQRIALAVAGIVLLFILLRIIARRREAAAWRKRSAELRRGYEDVRLQQEEVRKLADRIVATSSTNRIAGYGVVRQIEAVFTDGKPSSVAALELLKGLAAQKGANAIINVETKQSGTGKWVASGDAVIVKLIGRPGEPTKKNAE